MATNLYETLGVDRNASPEDVRKAYRKRALQTHPDRLPPNITQAEKAASEEQFRKVNNAYEVLNDEQNRKLYDRYGVWPPPTAEPEPQRRSSTRPFRSDPFSDPFFSDPFGSSRHPFTFTDPFVLFNSLFGDLHRAFFDEDPFFEDPLSARSPFDRMGMGDPFGHSMFGGSLFGPRPGLMIGGPGSMLRQMADASGSGDNSNSRMYSAVSQAVGRNGQWVSQSTMSRTINGRTEVITKRRDIEGNEHTTYSSPDGERYTINGVEQPLPNTNGSAIASPPPPPAQSQSRPPPQAIAAAPPPPASNYIPPTNSYYAQPPPPQPQQVYQPPPPAQAQAYPAYAQAATPPPRYSSSASTSGSGYAYPTQPAPAVEPIPVQHQQRNINGGNVYTDPYASAHKRTNSMAHGSSHGHHAYESASARSHHSHRDRDKDMERAQFERAHSHSHSHRDSHSPRESLRESSYRDSHHSRRDKERDREREAGHGGEQKWWRGGW